MITSPTWRATHKSDGGGLGPTMGPLDIADTGYGHSGQQVAVVTGDAEMLGGHFDAVHEQSGQAGYVRGILERAAGGSKS